jgi:hypothetical protein
VAVVHHPQDSILSKAFIAFIGLAVGRLEIPYLLVFLPRIDVLVQSAMVFNAVSGLAIPCKRMMSFGLAIAYGCLYIFHTKLPETWLRFNIALLLLLAFLSEGRHVLGILGMMVVAVQLYRSYMDTEAIWATLVIAFYLIRLGREPQLATNSPHQSYDIVPEIVVDDVTI